MNADECRRRAQECRAEAERSFGLLRADFLAAADTWDKLAQQFERTNLFGAVIQTNVPTRQRD